MPSIYGLSASCPAGGSSDGLLQHVVCIFTYGGRAEGLKDLKSVKTAVNSSSFILRFSFFFVTLQSISENSFSFH
jgi:hypothetical protein